MKYIPNSVTAKLGRTGLKLQASSPRTLFIAGVVGVGATVALTVRATMKLDPILNEHDLRIRSIKNSEHGTHKDVVCVYTKTTLDVGKAFSPVLVVGAASICALAGSHNILTKRNAGLTAAYAAIEKGFSEYRERVVSELGEDKDREFRYGTEVCEIETTDKAGKVVKTTETFASKDGFSIYARCFDETLSSWKPEPEYNLMFLRSKQNFANDLLHAQGHVFLNEIYDELGMERSKAGAVVGWVLNKDQKNDNFIDFGLFDDNPSARNFINRHENAIWLDFNVDGTIYDKI